MKKLFAIIIALMLVAALFAGCQETPAVETPTEAPVEATDAPEETEAPTATPEPTNTPEPTATPEPTPEPFTDPYKVEILDWTDADGQNSSFDTIAINNAKLQDYDGKVQQWKDEHDDGVVDGTDGKVNSVGMRGWAGFYEYGIADFGYQIDENPVIWVKRCAETTEPGVKAAGGDNAQRFFINCSVKGVYGEGHEVKVVVKLKDEEGTIAYLNKEDQPFLLYYNGPEAPEGAVDGVIANGEYTAQYSLKKNNAKTWTNGDMGSADIEYYISLKADGLYVGIDATGVAAGDLLQLDFNPGARIDDTPGLFVSFVIGDELKILQHNHATVLNPDASDGVDITALVEAKMTAKEGGYVIEAKLTPDFFSVTDVEKASEFTFGRENLYFGMFVVLGGAHGYTNQSTAPGTDWTCKGLGLHEYIAY